MSYILRISLFVILLSVMFLPFQSTNAQVGQTYEVNVEWIPIHDSPNDTAPIVGKLIREDKVTIFHEESGWGQTYYKGEKVWVPSKHLLPIEEKEAFLIDGLLVGYTIVIDPGHGGKDPGAIGHEGVLEKELILSTSLKLAEQLQKTGANVILTREDDSFVSLHDRVLVGNQHNTNAFISIHFNAFEEDYVGGFSAFYNHAGKQLATHIQMALAEEIPLRNRGISPGHFKVLKETKYPAVLLELGFITNTKEVVTLQSDSYQEKVSRAITNGLTEYFWQ